MFKINKIKYFVVALGISICVAPQLQAAQSNNQVSKKQWLEEVQKVVVVPICKGFIQDATISAKLKEKKVDYQQCLAIIPKFAAHCVKKYDPQIPKVVDEKAAAQWGHKIGECIGTMFAQKHLVSNH